MDDIPLPYMLWSALAVLLLVVVVPRVISNSWTFHRRVVVHGSPAEVLWYLADFTNTEEW